MRIAIALLALASSTSLSAATMITGNVSPTDFISDISHFDWNDPLEGIFQGSKVNVTFSINQGVIAAADFALVYSFHSTDKFPDAADSGTDYSTTDFCSFNGIGPNGCFNTDSGNREPSSLLANMIVGQKSLSFTITRPKGFERCDEAIYYPQSCRQEWVLNTFNFDAKVASQKPFSYTLAFGDAVSIGVPEPASWAMMISGFGLLGASLRNQRKWHLNALPKLA